MIIIINWQDTTHSDEPWLSAEDAKKLKPAEMVTIGTLIEDREDSVVVAGSWGTDGEAGDVNCIPKSAIRNIRVVEEEKPEEAGDAEGAEELEEAE